jgi:Fe-S-cluster-containing hydrogenase component 2/CRP-like cAMP-binding protein
MPANDFDELFERYESQYARDLDGRLIQIRPATLEDLRATVSLRVDGREVNVPGAVPATDDQGNVARDPAGNVVPRATTVYDAVAKAYQEGVNPVPVLCHQEHVKPIGVCRVCSVMTVRKGKAGDTLIPACVHPVVKGMEIHTAKSDDVVTIPGCPAPQRAGDYVRSTVKVLLQLLAAKHLHQAQPKDDPRYRNELQALAIEYGVGLTNRDGRFDVSTPFQRRKYDSTAAHADDAFSPVIDFDRNHCILCDRCVRACSEVKPFKIVGHTGFGHSAQISFDLGPKMADSDCVSCGECAVACPTGALTFRGTIYTIPTRRDPWADIKPRPETVPARDLAQRPLFAGVPYAYLAWNEGAVGRLECDRDTELCRAGEYGSTAFLIESGKVEVRAADGKFIAERTPADVLVGEMACLTNEPRTASLIARPGSTLLVLRRNMVHMLRRNRDARNILHPLYRKRALEDYLFKGTFFRGLPADLGKSCLEFLTQYPDDVDFVQVDPGQVIFRQGQSADYFYIIYRGHVSVTERNVHDYEFVRDYMGEGRHFGEIGLMSGLLPVVGQLLPPAARGRRTGTCTALDHVELVRIGREAFTALLRDKPGLSTTLEQTCRELLVQHEEARRDVGGKAGAFLKAGLYQGQNLLVLDLNTCTRCQECAKACAESHDGVSRLILEGNRFANYLVPSACRSCHDPLCLNGCPVDAIHRRPAGASRPGVKGLAIFIEDHCIGCGLCATNCPYGSIHMHRRLDRPTARIASNCDLCESLDGKPRCVHHCPHDAAHRQTGQELARAVGLTLLG